MFTRCPECETTFRLSAADLRRAQGRVRCGDCETVFNALEFLAEEPAESARQDRHVTPPDFARPARLTNQAPPEGDEDEDEDADEFDRDELEAHESAANYRSSTAARHADDNEYEPSAGALAGTADRAPPFADNDDERASDEDDSYLFDDDFGDDDEYSDSGILVTDADFELPGDWHDRSIVDYAVPAKAAVEAPPANEIWPDDPAACDSDAAPEPADSLARGAAESDAAETRQWPSAATGKSAESHTREQTATEPVLFALSEDPEDDAPEPVVGDDGRAETGSPGKSAPDTKALTDAAEIAGPDAVDPGSLTQQIETALNAGAGLSPDDAANPAATPDEAAPNAFERGATPATSGFEESAEADTEATAENRIFSFAKIGGTIDRQRDAQPADEADPLSDRSPERADSPADAAEFESFDIRDADATDPGEGSDARSEMAASGDTGAREPAADDDAEFESFEIWGADTAEPAAEEGADPASVGPSLSAEAQSTAAEADEFDDSVWERIPGVGSNEPVAAVIEDSLFARTGAGWDISQALGDQATELDQADEEPRSILDGPLLGATAPEDEGNDDPDEATADDETDVRLTSEPDYAAREGWQEEPDPDLSGFRDEFEPIEATRADLLEFNAPEDTWSSIFAPAQLEDPDEGWLDEDNDEDDDPDADWPALGSESEDDDLVRGLTSLPRDEEDLSRQWAKNHASALSGPGEDYPLAAATDAQPAEDEDIELQDVDSLQQGPDGLDDEYEDETAAGTQSDPYSEDTELPEGFAAEDYEVQHIVLEDQNDVAGLTQTFEQAPHGLSEAPPWHAEKYAVDAETPSRKGLWLLGSVILIAALATQLIHYNRDGLAAHPTWGNEVRIAYTVLGMDVYPEWSVRSYEIRGSEAVAGESGADIMDIRAQIASIDSNPTGLPYLRVVLRDRWSNPIAAQHFSPAEYAPADQLPADGIMQPNQTLAAHVSIEDPGAGAQGFELELCIPRRDTGLECTGQPFK